MLYNVADKLVQINDVLIPAVNIQVENVPGFIELSTGEKIWCGVYFEILFEDGGLWIVDQGSEEGDASGTIYITEFDNWGSNQDLDDQTAQNSLGGGDWNFFLIIYNLKRKGFWKAFT